jgi:hypothetical protein
MVITIRHAVSLRQAAYICGVIEGRPQVEKEASAWHDSTIK